MSEYFVGRGENGNDAGGDPLEPPVPGLPPEADDAAVAGAAGPAEPEHVRFGIPFNGVVPVWHDGTEITWHRPADGTDPANLLGLGDVETEPGPSPTPEGWSERVETGTLVPAGWADDPAAAGLNPATDGPVLRLHPAQPTGRRAAAVERGEGAVLPLGPAVSVEEAMGATAGDFDITGFSVHVARLMLRAARDGAILLLTLRAPRDPEAHHLLSAPSEVGAEGVMRFHLGTLLEVETGAWSQATHRDGMALLDLEVPYDSLLTGAGPAAEQGLDVERLVALAQPVVDAVLAPGFPFALGASFILPTR
ncbi:hypothetical protein [Actinomyces radicidentis]|uniref:hypothetical protein n=1 Tax=Actinomyces radicidentis TaxID=111015 RepID=UPI0026DF4B81|nr:hypothetical protein [Actinomyces radicidentis]